LAEEIPESRAGKKRALNDVPLSAGQATSRAMSRQKHGKIVIPK
jgi:hypothetical protein